MDDDDIYDVEFDVVQSAFTQQYDGPPYQYWDAKRAVLRDICKKLDKRQEHL